MAARYKVTFAFVNYIYGPSEVYYTPSITASALGPLVQTLVNKRNKLLFTTTQWVGVRIGLAPIGDLPAERRSKLWPPGVWTAANAGIELTVPARGLATTILTGSRQDQARSCMQVRVGFDTDRSSNRYFAFIPDSIILDEPDSLKIENSTTWFDDWLEFRQELRTSGWAIRARRRDAGYAPKPIISWVKSTVAPTNTGVEVLSAPAPGIAQNDKVQIIGARRRGTDKMSYNGIYRVSKVNPTLTPETTGLYLLGSEAGMPESVKTNGFIQKVGYDYFPIESFIGIRAGVHKRGKPVNSPRGRTSKRSLLDP